MTLYLDVSRLVFWEHLRVRWKQALEQVMRIHTKRLGKHPELVHRDLGDPALVKLPVLLAHLCTSGRFPDLQARINPHIP
jgi:hypothetical protein